MKKIFSYLVIAAVAVALGLLPGSAQAALDLNSGDTANTFATEIDIDGTDGTALANPGSIMDTTADCGFGAAANENRYIRFDLSNDAEFVANPTSYTLDGETGAIVAGGIDESYVIYGWTSAVAGDGTVAGNEGVLVIAGTGVTVYNQNSVTMSYAMYETAGDAVNQTSPLASSSATLIEFEAALAVDFDDVTPDLIDVSQGSLVFDSNGGDASDTTTEIADVNIGVDGNTLWTDGLAAAMTDIIDAGTQLVVAGDFTATQDLTDDVPDGTYTPATAVYIDNDGGCDDVNTGASAMDGTSATFNLDDGVVVDAATICIACNGVNEIIKGVYTGLYDVTAEANSDASDITLGTSLNPLSELQKNGTTRYVYNIPASDNSDLAYIRIYNTSAIDGTVYGTLRDQDGNVVGTASTVLVSDMASGTTQVFSAADLETLFGDTWTGRARMTIEAEIPSMEVQALIRSATGTITNMSPMAP